VNPDSPPGIRGTDDIGATLDEALVEARRLAGDAHAAQRERYQSAIGYVLLAALIVWFLLFVGLGLVVKEPDLARRMTVSFLVATVTAIAVGAPGAWGIRRRARPDIVAAKAWADRLGEAMDRRRSGERPTGSVFELLAEAAREVPRWLYAQRRAGLVRDPGTWGWIFLLVWLGVDILIGFMPSSIGLDFVATILVGVPSFGLLAAAAVLYVRWRRRREIRLETEQRDWDRRYEEVRGRMERFLEEL